MSITRVQFKHTYPGTTAAFASNVAAGNLIVVYTCGGDGTSTDASCSDSLGNTYTKAKQNLSGRANISVWYAYNISAGANTVTAQSGAADRGLTAFEYHSSVASFTTNPLDGKAGGGWAVGTASPLTLTITTSATGLLFCAWGDEMGSEAQTGWTSNLTQIQRDNGHDDGSAEGLNKTANTYTEGITVTSTSSGTSSMVFVGFKEPTASGSAVKTIGGLAVASVKTVGGLAIASVKTVGGLA